MASIFATAISIAEDASPFSLLAIVRMFIGLIIVVLYLIFGIATLVFAVSWPSQTGKGVFVAYVTLIAIVLPLVWLFLVFAGPQMYGGGWRYRRSLMMMQYSMTAISGAIVLVSSVLLFIYTVFKAMDRKDVPVQKEAGLANSDFSWVTDQTNGQKIQTLRKREWAFLIDHVLLFVAWACFGVSTKINNDWSILAALLIFLMFLLHVVQFVYLILKDAAHGRSFGKRVTGCRVVNLKTGIPIGPSQSAARNFVLLIPGFALVELVVASFRVDRRRLGDLIAGTVVVPENTESERPSDKRLVKAEVTKPHPLDD